MVLRVALLAAFAVFLGVFQSPVANGNGGLVSAERVRKSWRSFGEKEKELFIGAIQKGMESGMHYRFTEIHASLPSYDHAHNNCGFLLWHRKFLLAYENMLRAQDPQFKDVTLPYWNYFQDHDKQLASGDSCDSWLTCSKFLEELGGSSPNAPVKTIRMPQGMNVNGFCVGDGVAKYACASPDGKNDESGECDQCIVRGQWYNETSFLKISRGQITGTMREINSANTTTSDAHDVLRYLLEMGFHGEVHNTLGGVMMTQASPFDPVFYGHHGTVDMLHFIYNRCTYGAKDNKQFDVFSQCTVDEHAPDGTVISQVQIMADTDIVMDYGSEPAENDPMIGQFFQGVGSTYRDFANAQKLRDASNNYRYEVDSYFEAFFKSEGIECPSYVYASSKSKSSNKHPESTDSDDDESSEEEELDPVYEMIETLSACGKELRERMPSISHVEVAVQESILECEATRQRGGVDLQDYSPEFRETFRMPNETLPYCFGLLQEVNRGAITLHFSDHCRQEYGRLTGTNLTEGEFGKPFPSETTGSSSNSAAAEGDTESDKTRKQKNHHWRVSIKVHSE